METETLILSNEFSNPNLIVRASCPAAKPTWRRAGYLYQIVDIDGVGNQVESSISVVLLGDKLIRFPRVNGNYKIAFVPVRWLSGDILLTFWEADFQEILQTDPLEQIKQALNII